MNPILEHMLPYIISYTYVAVFLFAFLGAVALPLPTASMMIAVGFLSSLGYFNFWSMLFIGILGNIAGDHTGYWLARKLGKRLMQYPGFKRFRDTRLQRVEAQLIAHPGPILVSTRFMTAVAPSVNIVAGIAHMPFLSYTLYEVIGEILEVSIAILLGYWFGREWERASEYFFVFVLITVIGFYISYRVWKYLTREHSVDA